MNRLTQKKARISERRRKKASNSGQLDEQEIALERAKFRGRVLKARIKMLRYELAKVEAMEREKTRFHERMLRAEIELIHRELAKLEVIYREKARFQDLLHKAKIAQLQRDLTELDSKTYTG